MRRKNAVAIVVLINQPSRMTQDQGKPDGTELLECAGIHENAGVVLIHTDPALGAFIDAAKDGRI